MGVATTSATGQYYFSGFNNISKQPFYVGGLNLLPNHGYQIRIPNATSKSGGAEQAALIVGGKAYDPTVPLNGGATDGIIRDSNAIVAADGTTGLINITTGIKGANDHNLDAGFALLQPFLGNEVFEDVNNNGVYDAATDKLLQGVTVNLLDQTGAPIVGQTAVTDVNGKYLFANLAPGKYIVEIVTPAGYTSSTGNGTTKLLSAPGAYEAGVSDTSNQTDQCHTSSAYGKAFFY